MSIHTGRGDGGETSLAGGGRVSKADPRVEAYGAIDEAAAHVGLARALTDDPRLGEMLAFAQHRLLNCAAVTATPPDARDAAAPGVCDDDVAALASACDRFMDAAGPLSGFVAGGGTPLAAQLDVARAVVRRAERRVVALDEPADACVARFLNRLSDALFAASRCALAQDGAAEEAWDPYAPRPEG
ncbi:MAG: cob(I)yrinic acid a,c-diamide adenosyltransferase [Actinobacteria bacterium]|nr:MAG: cob(I)yrinic acid a,c-diamide adenosyltransferase [Actinomycetota bacterium]